MFKPYYFNCSHNLASLDLSYLLVFGTAQFEDPELFDTFWFSNQAPFHWIVFFVQVLDVISDHAHFYLPTNFIPLGNFLELDRAQLVHFLPFFLHTRYSNLVERLN
eukprot:sb/3477841/